MFAVRSLCYSVLVSECMSYTSKRCIPEHVTGAENIAYHHTGSVVYFHGHFCYLNRLDSMLASRRKVSSCREEIHSHVANISQTVTIDLGVISRTTSPSLAFRSFFQRRPQNRMKRQQHKSITESLCLVECRECECVRTNVSEMLTTVTRCGRLPRDAISHASNGATTVKVGPGACVNNQPARIICRMIQRIRRKIWLCSLDEWQ